ncbi:MAG: hypothetical protein LBP63_05535, partial [Prevotellaceae bacterium]|nr:hypothetical protein [Prevotellaceae bacterium]
KDYDQIKSITQSDKISEVTKSVFLQSAFEKMDADCQYKMLFKDCLIDIQKETPESQTELLKKYLDELGRISYSTDYKQIKSINRSKKVDKASKAVFLKSAFEKMDADCQYKMLFEDCLIDIQKETSESQTELLKKYLDKLGRISYSTNCDKIKSITQSDKISEASKSVFLQSAFEKMNAYCQYKMLFEDEIQKETPESQAELLHKYLVNLGKIEVEISWNFNGDKDWKYNQIKSIIQSDNISEAAKAVFLQSAFEKMDAYCQYKMLFEDCLIDIQNETPASQTELLKKYLDKLGQIDYETYDQIKSITQSDKISEASKAVFLQSAFEKMNADCQYKMLFEDCLIDIQKETPESQTELLKKYLDELGRSYSTKDYDQIKSITQSDKISEAAKAVFLQSAFEKAEVTYKIQMIIDGYIRVDNNILNELVQIYLHSKSKEKNEINYIEIPKIVKLLLWLDGINSHYDYLEFVQVAIYLSNEERKLFNERVKEYAKDERLKQFIEQIPKATVISDDKDKITYRCKWRNLYFKKGSISVFLDKVTATDDYEWDFAREEFNLLSQEYFSNRRIEDIIVTVRKSDNKIVDIKGLDKIEERIILAEIYKHGLTDRRIDRSDSQLTKLIHNVAARNSCIQFLSEQKSQYNAIDIKEIVSEQYGFLRRDISFLFPIPDGHGNVYLVWESAEFEKSKATHIFKCCEEDVENMEKEIKKYIENNIHIRSYLNSSEYKCQKKKRELQYFTRINHDTVEYTVWEDRMKEVMPFLKRIEEKKE